MMAYVIQDIDLGEISKLTRLIAANYNFHMYVIDLYIAYIKIIYSERGCVKNCSWAPETILYVAVDLQLV